MVRKIFTLFLVLAIASCVEPYEFKIRNNDPTIVIEAMITDKSYDDSRLFPSDGRYFTVKITSTGDVTNRRPEKISGAIVELVTMSSGSWSYTETELGVYSLLDPTFKAMPGEEYKLIVYLGEEDSYESEWEKLPQSNGLPMGDIGFTETERKGWAIEAGKNVIRTKLGIETFVNLPTHEGSPVYYQWRYTPTWIYKAPLSSSSNQYKTCWATDINHLKEFSLQKDNVGGYRKDMFFIETVRNERIFEMFSVLINQYELNEKNFFFWQEMQQQANRNELSDTPPFNLKTNFYNADEKMVSGYFDVAREQAKRWYFNTNDLSYPVTNTLQADCLVVYGPDPPAEECFDCREYSHGVATTTRPLWWID